jgi:capsular exopolysaccharide synthesis family protein
MALSGSKVLLVDGDQRRCSLNEKLKMPMEPGFSDVLTRKLKLSQAVLQTDIPSLWFLPRGTAIKNPGELFIGSPANDFLREVYDQYDFILIDTPPVLAADDTTSLAPKVDGVLFVVRGEFTSARLARQSLELLYNRHTRVLGLVYNRANLFLPEYSYYKYASYYQTPESGSKKGAAVKKEKAPEKV